MSPHRWLDVLPCRDDFTPVPGKRAFIPRKTEITPATFAESPGYPEDGQHLNLVSWKIPNRR